MPNPAYLFQEKSGALSSTSIGTETTFGTAVTPTSTLPQTGNTMVADPGLFYPALVMGVRDKNIFPLYGQAKNTGALDGALFPTNGIELLIASIGADGTAGNGVTGSSPASSTTLSAATTVGATSVTVTSATGYTVGEYVQIDANSSTGPTTAECRKIVTVASTTLTLDSALKYAHASGAAIAVVSAPFTHTIVQQNVLPSLTIEQNLGGFQSIQFPGTRVNKFDIKGTAGDSEATVTADLIAQSWNILSTPSATTVVNETPFVFSEFALTWDAGTLAQATNISLSIDNALKSTYTFNNTRDLQFLTPVTILANGQFDVVFDSLNDATYGYFTQLQNGIDAALSIAFTHPSSGGSITLNMPTVRLGKDTFENKMEDVIMEQITFEAHRSLVGSGSPTINATIVNDVYLSY